jgi:uncharacterized protein (DUF2147 family)
MKSIAVATLIGLIVSPALAAESPIGEWTVEDGTARIRILRCDDNLWGVISWTKDTPGKDENNPDPAKRERSVMGIPILIDMKPSGKKWTGTVYNADDGRSYTSNINLKSKDVLRIEGCVMGGYICSGEDWTRYNGSKPSETDPSICSRVTKS